MDETAILSLNPFSMSLLLLLSIFILFLNGVWVTLPLLISAFYITSAQGVEIGFASLYVSRILCLLYLVRFFIRNDFKRIKRINDIDKLMVVFVLVYNTMVFFQKNNDGLYINNIGRSIDIVMTYLCFRLFVQKIEDLEKLIVSMLIMLIPIMILMVYEKVTGYNFLSFLGGVPEYSAIRENVIRAQGPFQHPITAGTTAGTLIPLFYYFFYPERKFVFLSTLGIMGTIAIIYSTGSSGPIMTALFSCIGLAVWTLRDKMRIVRYSLISACILSEIYMKAHFWYILAKIDLVGGSTGYHRAELITQAINHINEWWLVGTNYTRHWMPTGVSWSVNQTDITNMYISMGVLGGLPLLILFILIIVVGFQYVGKAMHSFDSYEMKNKFLFWVLGVTLFSHILTFFTISYFDQIEIFYYMLIASISSLFTNITELNRS